MDTYFFHPDLTLHTQISLPQEEAKHLKTLRVQAGDELFLVNGKGILAKGRVISPQVSNSLIEVIEIVREKEERPFYIHVALAPTKNADRVEWFLEKAVEIGIDEISFLQTKRSEKMQLKSERLFKKAVAAIKQSLRSTLPIINPPLVFAKFLEKYNRQSNDFVPSSFQSKEVQRFMAYTPTQKEEVLEKFVNKNAYYIVLIGSEGGFTEEEAQQAQQAGFKCVSLGHYRLRTETAALYSCMALNSLNR